MTKSEKNEGIYIIMVGLPARGKSTIAQKLLENLRRDRIKARIFNNGDLRRKLSKENTSYADFFNPKNTEGVALREKYALINMNQAKRFLERGGNVAILDATNVSRRRRQALEDLLGDQQILYIECINTDEETLNANIHRKVCHPEFVDLSHEAALDSFLQRIRYYEQIYDPLKTERNYVKLDTFHRRIIREEVIDGFAHYSRIRDFLVTETVKNLYLIRHPETTYNLENRIGGDPPLTRKGKLQAQDLASFFQSKKLPLIFTSTFKRTIEAAEAIKRLQDDCTIIPLQEFDEINAGICEEMTYREIREKLPEVAKSRKEDKYSYTYPEGEGYASMESRIERGIKKTLYLTDHSDNIMIVGHQAVNRMILSHFVYRRHEDVPYIYIPQNKFYHIVVDQNKKLFVLKKF
jgi:broad specificity phosphatase PhoE/predicted kinase